MNLRITTSRDGAYREPNSKKELMAIIEELIKIADNEEIINIKVYK